MQDIYDFVVLTLVDTCKVDPKYITPATDLFSDLGIDSTDILSVTYTIEERYGIQIPIGDWMSEVNVGDAAATEHFRIDNFVAAVARIAGEAKAT